MSAEQRMIKVYTVSRSGTPKEVTPQEAQKIVDETRSYGGFAIDHKKRRYIIGIDSDTEEIIVIPETNVAGGG